MIKSFTKFKNKFILTPGLNISQYCSLIINILLLIYSHQAIAITTSSSATNNSIQSQSYITSPHAKTIIAGFILNGKDTREDITLLQLSSGNYAVNLDQFAKQIFIIIKNKGPLLLLVTPLGNAELQAVDVIQDGKHRFFPLKILAKKLGSKLIFDEQEFAIKADLPWNPGTTQPGAVLTTHQVKPDIYAPSLSLSSWHSEAYYTHNNNNNTLNTFTDLGGALGPGFWRLRYYTNPGGQNRLTNYGWIFDNGNSRWLLGHDQLALDPLLPYSELTGVQYAWTNSPNLVYGASLSADQFVASQLFGGQTISGSDGPPGGIAELRVNGNVVSHTAIRLNGDWRFRDISLRGDENVEVALYRRFGDSTPVKIESVSVMNNAQSLPAGTVISYGGVGINGNPLDPTIGSQGPAGFYQWRYGVNQHLSVGATAQRANGDNYGMVNIVNGFGVLGTWGASLGHNGSIGAWSIIGNGQTKNYYWSTFAVHRGANYFNGITSPSDDRYGMIGWKASPNLDLTLTGRSVNDPVLGNQYSFIKPGFNWRLNTLNFSAQPDYFGGYSYNLSWLPNLDNQLSFSRYSGVTQLQWERSLGHGYSSTLSITKDGTLGTRYSALLSGLWPSRKPIIWSAGILSGRGRLGYLLDAAVEAVPGLSAHLQLLNDPLSYSIPGGGGLLLQFIIVADFAVTSSGLARGTFNAYTSRFGSISGKIDGKLPVNVSWADLKGTLILVNGRPRSTLDSNGHYIISNLTPGVYQVQLDPGHLPIDLIPSKFRPWVEVRSGVTTTANFHVILQLGFAGRITKMNKAVAGASVKVFNLKGKKVGASITDTWGYYRVDGLLPGTYIMRVDGNERKVILIRSFLFKQNIFITTK